VLHECVAPVAGTGGQAERELSAFPYGGTGLSFLKIVGMLEQARACAVCAVAGTAAAEAGSREGEKFASGENGRMEKRKSESLLELVLLTGLWALRLR
jgi:hypothetical protein